VLLQGRTEYIEKYFETARNLTAKGFTVATLDWRGQGGSQRLLKNPRKGHVGHFDHYERDLDIFMAWVRAECPAPHYALAHSMGGLILFRSLRRKQLWFERVVLAAPMLGLGPIYRPIGPARALTGMVGTLGFRRTFIPTGSATPTEWQPFLGNKLTSDPVRYARNAAIIEANPALGLGSPTVGWAASSFRTMGEVVTRGFVEQITTPTLIVAAGKDRIVSNVAIEEVGRRLRIGRHIVVHGASHELLTERDVFREQLLAAVDAFLTS
jgi:lysophospholipase